MAIVSTIDSNWTSITGKTLSVQSKLVSKMKEVVIDVALGACDNYVTGGIVVDLSASGVIGTVISATVQNVSNSLQATYVPDACPTDAAATGTVKFVDEVAAACSTALAEIACASTLTNSMTFQVHVLGF